MTEAKKPRKQLVYLSHLTFAMFLEELLSGPATANTLAEHTGMSGKYVRRFLKVLHARKVVHISGWEKDAMGRVAVRVYALGHGRDAKKPLKTRESINRDYRTRAAGAFLSGTPFAGLMA